MGIPPQLILMFYTAAVATTLAVISSFHNFDCA